MSTPRPTARGLHDIKTTRAVSNRGELPHQIYLRIASLEMERHRREQERIASMTRGAACAKRVEQIDADIGRLRERIEAMGRSGGGSAPASGGEPRIESRPVSLSKSRRLTHRY